jgi:hypothetical protein
MAFEGLTPVTDVEVGDWLEPRMCGFGGRVCSVVPTAGFEAVARVLHPAEDEHGDPATWTDVCARLGRTPHALMQWRSIARVRQVEVVEGRWPRRRRYLTTTSEWAGQEPREGNLPPAQLVALLDVLERHTDPAADCFHAVWEGWGWLDGGGVAYLSRSGGRPGPAPPGVSAEALAAPLLQLPGRGYVLFRGPLRAATTIGHSFPGGGSFWPQSPNLLWSENRSWCVATEIDFDSTLVAGDRALVDAVLAAPGLEAWPVDADDDLTVAGDRVNG